MTSSSAVISECGKYRYRLERVINPFGLTDTLKEKNLLVFGINPSTADADTDDATIRKLKVFCTILGADVLTVVNPFAYRATKVSELAKVEDPVGDRNRAYITESLLAADIILLAWGNLEKVPKKIRGEVFWAAQEAVRVAQEKGKRLVCFGYTANGCPRHPLMLSYATPVENYEHRYSDYLGPFPDGFERVAGG